MNTVAKLRLANQWLDASRRPERLEDMDTGDVYTLEMLPNDEPKSRTASLAPSDFTQEPDPIPDLDPKAKGREDIDPLPFTIDDTRRLAEAAFRTGSPTLCWLLWQMREDRQ